MLSRTDASLPSAIWWIGARTVAICLAALALLLPEESAHGQLAGTSKNGDETGEFSAEAIDFFEREVRPVLIENCKSCHSESVANVKGGLNLDSREAMLRGGESGPAFEPGAPDHSLLIEAVRRESFEMPPDKSLSKSAIAILEKWIAMGAPWPSHPTNDSVGENWIAVRAAEHWAWQPVKPRPIPSVRNNAWGNRPLDSFILAKLEEQSLEPAPSANALELLRRLHFDLIGLPPSKADVDAFVNSSSTNPELAYERRVDELLSSPQYGIRWGRHWLDLMRYAETLGHEFDYPARYAWRYRDVVIDSFNTDTPYRQFIIEHLAGDLVDSPRRHPVDGINQSLTATGWWWLGDSVHAPVDITNDWATRVDNQIDVLSKSFMGLTIACARCHDHKFDAIAAADYYGLDGIIRSTRRRYAITDPSGLIQKHNERMIQSTQSADQLAKLSYRQISRDAVRSWLGKAVDNWKSLSGEELKKALPHDSPLAALRLLIEESDEFEFAQQLRQFRSQLEQDRADWNTWLAESRQFADFSKGLPEGWYFDAAEDALPETAFDWFGEKLPIPRPMRFSSTHVGRKQDLTLRSPTFDVERRCVCIKMRGKSTQSAVVVSNYFMQEFHGLLFGDLKKPIDQPTDQGWITHAGDLNKYIGHPAFLAFDDESEAWFEIEEVRFADRAPPKQPHDFSLELLKASPASQAALEALIVERLGEALQSIGKASKDATPSPEAIEVCRATIQAFPNDAHLLFTERAASLIANSKELQSLDQKTPSPTRLLTAEEGTPRDAHLAVRGNPHTLGELIPRGCLQSLVPWEAVSDHSSGRQELAESLVHPTHPLTARVMVNRVWHHLMGRGLVGSPDNLGVLGSRPTHPELLDYLAQQFVEHDWSIKWLIHEIVLSQTYQLSSERTTQQTELDPDGQWWSHRSVRRLSAEALRDALLAASSSIDAQLAGPSVPIHLTEQMTGRGRPGTSGPLDGNNRRSVYVEVRRNFLNPFLLAFDFPMPSTTTGKRNISNVPAQALGLLNDPLVVELSKRWVDRILLIDNPVVRIETMFLDAFGRLPTPDEQQNCLNFVTSPDSSGWHDLAHVMLNAKEFSYLK